MLTVTTPMTQAAVKLVRDQSLPIVFAPVTDPVAAGLVPDWQHGSARFVGASNMQSTETVIDFAGKLLGKPLNRSACCSIRATPMTSPARTSRKPPPRRKASSSGGRVNSVNDIAQRRRDQGR